MLSPSRAQELCESRGGRPGPSLIVLMASVDIKQHWTCYTVRVQELCEGRGGPDLGSPSLLEVADLGSPSLIVLMVSGRKATLSYVKVEVAVLGSSFLIVLMVSVDVKQRWTRTLPMPNPVWQLVTAPVVLQAFMPFRIRFVITFGFNKRKKKKKKQLKCTLLKIRVVSESACRPLLA